jgi:hypothetical protein
MAKRSRAEITQSLGLISWLYWQILRRQRDYTAAVACCKQRWATELEASEDSLKRLATERALLALNSLEHYCWTGDRRRDEVAVSMMIDDGMRFSCSLNGLEDFVQKWKITFPIPPSIPVLPAGELLTSPWCVPVKLVDGDKQRVVMDIFPDLGVEIVSAHIRGVLLHFARKRKTIKPGTAQLISRKPGVKLNVSADTIPRNGLRVTVGLPVNLESLVDWVKAEINRVLRVERTETTWRSQAYYERMLAVVDAYRRGEQTAPQDFVEGRSLKDWIDSFNSLVGLFDFPSTDK